MKLEQGCIQVYTGNGKGKTTSAIGLALRASGHGMKTTIIQFMKGKTNYGELEAIGKIPEISLFQYGTDDFVFKGSEKEIDYSEAIAAMDRARQAIADPDLSILILDEINVALLFELVNTGEVIELLKSKPKNLEVVLTGRGAPDEIKAIADLVTDFVEVKHYYNTIKLEARQGIEF